MQKKQFSIYLNPTEIKILQRASNFKSLPVSVFVRSSAIENARKILISSGLPLDFLIEEFGFDINNTFKEIKNKGGIGR